MARAIECLGLHLCTERKICKRC